ncbi:UDP-4-amino-4,6-dideoxy-N-acetyl-beta-L-altrosamine N-acetyltransferase [Bacillus salitolerans]|uniref:UDP-4-amino-4, 6-dideoxy-N-acetyl-beta-L-altrosamine N-acetyltransferase n=1 Tax=Bacillus salitolerans TaxID=1437434 RepID=A0ABW4LQH8_9BACI
MDFIRLSEEHLELVLRWRTSKHVTKYMYTDIEFNMENQNKWYSKVNDDPSQKYWIISYNGEYIGLVSLNDFDLKNARSSWAFYIGENKYAMIAGRIGPYIYNYAFSHLKLNKLYGEVLEENKSVRKMHLMNGCREVGYFSNHILKHNKYHNVYLYEMMANDWNREENKYLNVVGRFEDQ